MSVALCWNKAAWLFTPVQEWGHTQSTKKTSNHPGPPSYCMPPVVVLACSQIQCVWGGGLALLSLELRAGELPGFTVGVPRRTDANINRQKKEKQQWRAQGMLQEREINRGRDREEDRARASSTGSWEQRPCCVGATGGDKTPGRGKEMREEDEDEDEGRRWGKKMREGDEGRRKDDKECLSPETQGNIVMY